MNLFFKCMISAAIMIPIITKAQEDIPASEEISLDFSTTMIVLSNSNTAFDVYNRLKGPKYENLVFSPYSLTVALGIIYAGSDGNTQSQMARVLRFPIQAGAIGPAFADLSKKLNRVPRRAGDSLFLNISNGLWIQRGYNILPEFRTTIVDSFGATLKQVDFNTSADTVRIEANTWIRERTQGKINEVFARGEIARDTKLLIVSTMYMKGKWQKPFEPDFTRQTAFFPHPSQTITVPIMSTTGNFRYLKASNYAIVEIPYDMREIGKDLDLVMQIILPDATYGLEALEKELDSGSMSNWTSAMKMQKVVVSIPKFSLTSSIGLVDILKQMGMTTPFSNSADLAKIDGTQNLFVSNLVQKATIIVDEKGTEAGVSTGAVVSSKAIDTVSPQVFLADHPFMYLVVDRISGAILFMGRVTNPAK